jgi:hypothetical protein
MYDLQPLKLYVHERVHQQPHWLQRAERIVNALGRDRAEMTTITEESLPRVVAELQALWPPENPPDGVPTPYLRPLVFTVLELDGPVGPDTDALVDACPEGTSSGLVNSLWGRTRLVRPTHPREADAEQDMVCWPTYDFGAMRGCPHGCLYCGEGHGGQRIALGCNLEEYMEQVVGPTIEEYPWQRCFRMIGFGADLTTFEPEYGLFDLFTRKLAEYEGRYGYFHTAGDNVDWIADLPHKDRLIGVWSLTCDAVVRRIEQGGAGAAARVEAGRRCQQMGLPVRFKFKPIIPVRNWREQYAPIIEQALTRAQPESVGLCVLMWKNYRDMVNDIDPDLLDPDMVDAARQAADRLEGVRTGPFPHEKRAEIYRFFIEQIRRHDADVPVYVSTESREMWDELGEELGQEAGTYVCGCGPVALPGRRLALSKGCPHSTSNPVGS